MPSVSELLVRIDATTEGLRRELLRAERSVIDFGQKADRNLTSIDNSFSKLGAGIGNIQGALGTLGVAMGGMELARGFIEMADASTTMENRLKTVTSSAEELRKAQDMLFESSQNNSVETSTSVELFARLSRALQGTGADAERVVEMVDTLAKVTRLSGTTTAEASAALLQLSQALQKGKLNGDEFRSMGENLPMLLQAIAEETAKLNGISLEQAKAELAAMSEEGKLTTDIIVSAVENMRDKTVDAFEELQSTAAGAATRMWNSLTRIVGKIDDVTNVSGNLVDKIDGVSSAFDLGISALDRYGGSLSALLGWINAIPHPLSLLAQAAAGAAKQVSQAAGEIQAAMKAASQVDLSAGLQPWQTKPGEAGKWQGNITTRGRPEELAQKMAGGLKVLEATGGRRVSPAITNPMDVAGITGSAIDFTTFGVGAGGTVTGVTQERPKLKFYKGPSKEEKKVSEALQKKADQLKESVKTPQEQFQTQVAEYNELLAQKLINPEEYSRAFREAGSNLQDTLMRSARTTAKPESKLAGDLQQRAARVRAEIQTADEEYNAQIENLTELRKKGQITEQEFTRGAARAKTELTEAKKPKGGGGGGRAKEDKEQKAAERIGKSVFKETRTDAEAYAEEIERLDDLLARNAISQEDHARAVEAAGIAMQESRSAFAGGQEAARAYLDEIARLDGLLQSGAISQDEHSARVVDAQQKYGDAKSSASEYAAEVARLDEALRAGAISEEEHAASLSVARANMNEGLQEAARLFEETRTPLERYNEEIRKLTELWAAGVIGDDTKLRASQQAWEDLRGELEETNASMKAAKALGDDLGMSFASAFEDAIIEGGKLRDIMQGLWKDIQRIVVRQMVTVPLATGLSSILTGVTGAMMGGTGAAALPPSPAMGAIGARGQHGGLITGPGTGTSDSIPAIMPGGGMARLSSGEFIVNARSVEKHERLIRAINDDSISGPVARRIDAVLNSTAGENEQPQSRSKPFSIGGPAPRQIERVLARHAIERFGRGGHVHQRLKTTADTQIDRRFATGGPVERHIERVLERDRIERFMSGGTVENHSRYASHIERAFAVGGKVSAIGGPISSYISNAIGAHPVQSFAAGGPVARRIGSVLAPYRSFAVGGKISAIRDIAAPQSVAERNPGNIEITLENKSSQPLKMEGARQGPGPDGRTMIRVMVVDAVKEAMAAGEFDRNMGARYGASIQPIGR